jgi:hypothetical protein
MVQEGPGEEDLKTMFRRELFLMAGYDNDEIDNEGLLELQEEDLREAIKLRLLGSKTDDNNNQKAVPIEEIEVYLNEGWEFMTKLSDSKVIMRLPTQ